jgi:hypothetical protein
MEYAGPLATTLGGAVAVGIGAVGLAVNLALGAGLAPGAKLRAEAPDGPAGVEGAVSLRVDVRAGDGVANEVLAGEVGGLRLTYSCAASARGAELVVHLRPGDGLRVGSVLYRVGAGDPVGAAGNPDIVVRGDGRIDGLVYQVEGNRTVTGTLSYGVSGQGCRIDARLTPSEGVSI